jgi:hypothetical protein
MSAFDRSHGSPGGTALARIINWLALLAAFLCTLFVKRDLDRLELYELYSSYGLTAGVWPMLQYTIQVMLITAYIIGILAALASVLMLVVGAVRTVARVSVAWPDTLLSFANIFAVLVLVWSLWNVSTQLLSAYGSVFVSGSITTLYVAIPSLLIGVLLTKAGLGEPPGS